MRQVGVAAKRRNRYQLAWQNLLSVCWACHAKCRCRAADASSWEPGVGDSARVLHLPSTEVSNSAQTSVWYLRHHQALSRRFCG